MLAGVVIFLMFREFTVCRRIGSSRKTRRNAIRCSGTFASLPETDPSLTPLGLAPGDVLGPRRLRLFRVDLEVW